MLKPEIGGELIHIAYAEVGRYIARESKFMLDDVVFLGWLGFFWCLKIKRRESVE